jgi:hypothetical protein
MDPLAPGVANDSSATAAPGSFVPRSIRHVVARALERGIRAYNAVIRALHTAARDASDRDIAAIRARAAIGTDISSHLEPMFLEGLRANPGLIVELGVRGGEATFVLERVARRCRAPLVSVDIADCSTVSQYERWHFVQEDDVAFGRRVAAWCREQGLPENIDLLVIDTTHLYEHTLAEIEAWFPHLSPTAVVMFHDTNLRRLFRRRDGTLGLAWSNNRGVIQALETVLHTRFNERRPFERDIGPWRIVHDPICNGLTVLRRKAGPEPGRSGES